MKKFKDFVSRVWQPLLTVGIGAGIVIFILGFRLGSMTPGFSPAEIDSLTGTHSLRAILENPMFLPYKLAQWGLLKLGFDLPILIRGVSAIIGAVCVWGFYLLLKRWHPKRIAILGCILFLCSTWFLSAARSATPTILYVFNTLSIIFIGALVHQKKASKSSLLLAAICGAILVYSPGMIWLLLIGGIWQYKGIVSLLKQNPVWLWLTACIVFGALLAPAIYAVYNDWRLVLDIIGIPDKWIPAEIAKRVVIIPAELFVQGSKDAYWLGRLPIMDLFTGAMFAMGVYNYYLRYTLTRTKFLLWLSGVLVVLTALFGLPTITFIPIVYIVIVGGITLLLQQWFTVFPFNPIARYVGLGLIIVVAGLSCWYQLNRYFVAWRHNPTTQAVYQLKLDR